jgi:hypothetical protein
LHSLSNSSYGWGLVGWLASTSGGNNGADKLITVRFKIPSTGTINLFKTKKSYRIVGQNGRSLGPRSWWLRGEVMVGESWKHAPEMELGTPVGLNEQSWHRNGGWDGQGKDDSHSRQRMNGVGSGGGDRRS